MSAPEKLPFLPVAHHYAIAAVAARSAQLDHTVELVGAALLGMRRNTAEFLLRNLGADRVIGLVQALLLDEFPAETEAVKTLIAGVNKARSDRNKILHWLWGKSEASDTAILATYRPFRESQEGEMTAAEIQAVAAALLAATLELNRWSDKAFAALRASWPQRFERPSHLPGLALPSDADHQGTPGLLDPPLPPSQE